MGALDLFTGVTAIWGGIELAGWPDGTGPVIRMPLSMLEHSPFHDFFVPGLLLFWLVGVLNLIAGVLVLRRHRWSEFLAVMGGGSLTVWIVTEMVMLRAAHWLQVLYLVVGLGTLATALGLWRLRTLRRS
ncbi:hypothetical protein [Hyalangium versicolor]|uniref:hypothetical protein n=1 Tax=Hyalangium versicolor TaxID=2861190 RepID=UPI001CCAA01E|nr:hypothetical protein [Hyalangium versicolor]